MDAGTMVAAVETLKQASSLAKTLISTESIIEKAELRLKLADLLVMLADARQAIAESAEELAARDADIRRLEEALRMKGRVERRGDAYFQLDDNGAAHGDALCSHCWEHAHELIHLTTAAGNLRERTCPHCKHTVPWSRIRWPASSDGGGDGGPSMTVGRVIRG